MNDQRQGSDDPRADDHLWSLVAAIPVPDAGPDFMQQLAVRIAAETNDSATSVPFDRAASAALPGPRVRGRRFSARLAVAAAAVVALAAVVAFAVLPALRGTDVATAADMLASMSLNAPAQTLHLVLVRTESTEKQDGSSYQESMDEDLTLSITGDYRGTVRRAPQADGETAASEFGYDAARQELRAASPQHSDGLEVLQPAWPTEMPDLMQDYLGYKATASSVRALLAEIDPQTPVKEIAYLGRPAWQATLPRVLQGAPDLTVTVDKATGLLLETRQSGELSDGRPFERQLRVTSFETDPALAADWQVVPLLEKPTATLQWNYFIDRGTRFGSPETVAERAWPTLPLIPQWAPSGYQQDAVANAVYEDPRPYHEDANSSEWSNEIVKEPGTSAGLDEKKRLALNGCAQGVLILFRRGFDSFTVEISPRLPGEPGLRGLSPESSATAKDTVLTGGYLKGGRARTWISSAILPVSHVNGDTMYVPYQGPTLLTYSDRSQVVIYGDLTRRELVDVANSLRAYGDVARPLPAN